MKTIPVTSHLTLLISLLLLYHQTPTLLIYDSYTHLHSCILLHSLVYQCPLYWSLAWFPLETLHLNHVKTSTDKGYKKFWTLKSPGFQILTIFFFIKAMTRDAFTVLLSWYSQTQSPSIWSNSLAIQGSCCLSALSSIKESQPADKWSSKHIIFVHLENSYFSTQQYVVGICGGKIMHSIL